MRNTTRPRPADFVKPRLPEARIQRMWLVVEHGQSRGVPLRATRSAYLGVIAAAACIMLLLWTRPWAVRHVDTRSVATGDTIATEARERQVALPEGSVLSMGPSTRIDVVRVASDEVRLRLVRGALTCEVPRVEGRQFVVEAGSADVTVKGTRFTVEFEPGAAVQPEFSVGVQRGRVQLRLDGRTVTAVLETGQTWSSQKASPVPSATLLPTVAPQVAASSSATGAPNAAPSAVSPARPSAHELMDRANAARTGGQPAQAAREYSRLSDWYPRDPRAGLAAFELGRIRLNSLGDARGALDAFRFALAHPGGFFAEDAETGMVEALDRMGDVGACVKARNAFLDRHANGSHAKRVRLMCGSQ